MYRVFLMPSAQLNFQGECCVSIKSEKFVLCENPDGSCVVVEWNIRAIRRYATDENNNFVKIENGR